MVRAYFYFELFLRATDVTTLDILRAIQGVGSAATIPASVCVMILDEPIDTHPLISSEFSPTPSLRQEPGR